MKKYNFRFKVLNFRGETKKPLITLECPDFKEESRVMIINGKEHTITFSIEEQLDNWLEKLDKRNLMDENDWYAIIDYTLEKPKQEHSVSVRVFDLAKQYLSNLDNGDRIFNDFVVTYDRLFDKLKKLTPTEQFSAVLESLCIGYDAQSESYRQMLAIMRDEEKDDFKKLMYGEIIDEDEV